MTESICNGNCDECCDAECKVIEIKSFHKLNWTKDLKMGVNKIFEDLRNGKFEEDDDEIWERDSNGD